MCSNWDIVDMRAKKSDSQAEPINVHASRQQRATIDRAAEVLGKSRPDFMLDAACPEAESGLLDRSGFALSEKSFKRVARILDNPTHDNPKLRRLLETKAP